MPYTFIDNQMGLPAVTDIVTATEYLTLGIQAGTIMRAVDPVYGAGEFILLKGVASTAIGTWVTYNLDDNTTTRLAANAIGPVAVSMAANTAATTYSWYQISGKAVGLCLAGFVDNANVYATATAGSVDDAIVAGDRVKGAVGASAIGTPSGSFAEFEIMRPFMDDGLAA
jgi:hypothetical protein